MTTEEEILELLVGPEEGGERLDRFLCRRLGGLSRAKAAEIIRSRLVAAGKVKNGAKVRPGQRIRLGLRLKRRREPDFPLQVLHEDEWIVVLNKPAGQLVHPPRRGITNTLVERLEEHLGRRAYFPHRLDRETSGLLVAARDAAVAGDLSRMFISRAVAKRYIAVVQGCPDPPSGIVDLPLGRDLASPIRDRQRVDAAGGRPAVTEYRTLLRVGARALVALHPRSGRLHQIRVHLEALGTPLVGDKIYGRDETLFLRFLEEGFTDDLREKLVLSRHALHANGLSFRHPGYGCPMEFTAPLPEDMLGLLEEAGKAAISCNTPLHGLR